MRMMHHRNDSNGSVCSRNDVRAPHTLAMVRELQARSFARVLVQYFERYAHLRVYTCGFG